MNFDFEPCLKVEVIAISIQTEPSTNTLRSFWIGICGRTDRQTCFLLIRFMQGKHINHKAMTMMSEAYSHQPSTSVAPIWTLLRTLALVFVSWPPKVNQTMCVGKALDAVAVSDWSKHVPNTSVCSIVPFCIATRMIGTAFLSNWPLITPYSSIDHVDNSNI